MSIYFEMIKDILIVVMAGELDHHSAAKVREEIDQTFDVFSSRHLVFDMSKLTFMDSSGIAVVLGRYNKVEALGGRLVIAGACGHIEKILSMSGVFSIIGRADRKESAIVMLGGYDEQ